MAIASRPYVAARPVRAQTVRVQASSGITQRVQAVVGATALSIGRNVSSMPGHRIGRTISSTPGLLVSPAIAGVEFDGIKNGATVTSPAHLAFKVDGLTVKPAADGYVTGTGHFHVLIDQPTPEEGEAIPFDDAHKHYGKGQIADDITLGPGKHNLTLVFANARHESYGPKFSSTVSVNVK